MTQVQKFTDDHKLYLYSIYCMTWIRYMFGGPVTTVLWFVLPKMLTEEYLLGFGRHLNIIFDIIPVPTMYLALDSISLPWPCSEKPGDNRQTTIYIFSWSQHALGQDWAGQNQSPASGSTKAEHQNVKWWTHSIQPPPPSPSRSCTAHNRFNWAELNNPLLLGVTWRCTKNFIQLC